MKTTLDNEQLTLLLENVGHGCLKTLLINAHGVDVDTLDGCAIAAVTQQWDYSSG